MKASEFWGYGCVAADGKAFIKAGDGPAPSKWTENTAVAFVLEESAHINGHDMKAGAVVMMDPRVLIAGTGKEGVIWEPRMLRGGLHPKWVREWLHDHPEWPYETMKERMKANEARQRELGQEIRRLEQELRGTAAAANYRDALEWQLSALRIFRNPQFAGRLRSGFSAPPFSLDGNEIKIMLQSFEDALTLGEPFYVSREIGNLIATGAAALPAWTLQPELLPVPAGNFWFASPLPIRVFEPDGEKQHEIELAGLGWLTRWSVEDDRGGSVDYYRTPQDVQAAAVSARRTVFVTYFGKSERNIGPTGVFEWNFGQPHTAPARHQKRFFEPADIPQVAPILAAALAFVSQRILVNERTSLDRSARRRLALEAPDLQPFVNVIALRRRESHSDDSAGNGEPVEWSCRWLVTGHWRQQPYPSKGITQPIWIAPYIKGPDDRPLKHPRGRIFAVVR